MKFSELKFTPRTPHNIITDSIQSINFFDNGYGVSIVRFPGSYGFTEGLYEVAVIKGTEFQWEIYYDSKITDGVVGYCDEKDIENIMEEVQSL